MSSAASATDPEPLRLRRGLALPLPQAVAAKQPEDLAAAISRIGVLGVGDFPGLRPTMQVAEGDSVAQGQPLWVDKHNPALIGTSPVSGKVAEINRGLRRALLSVSVEADAKAEPVKVKPLSGGKARRAANIRKALIAGGQWALLRQRPYDKTPAGDATCAAILVTALDTRPFAAEPAPLIEAHSEDFVCGLEMLAELTSGPVLVCYSASAASAASTELPLPKVDRIKAVGVSGPHPAGLAGVLLHHLFPPATDRQVWIADWQAVIAMGQLLRRGELPTQRYVSLGGEGFARPRVVRAPIGACVSQLCAEQLNSGNWRLIAGSPLYGHTAEGAEDFLSRHRNQVSAVAEGGDPVFMNWLRPGLDRYSRMPVFSTAFNIGRAAFNTLRNGGERGLIPVEVYQDSMPLEVPMVHLLKSLLVGDTEQAQRLGCLELGPEDLSVCTYVCPSKYDYGAVLRAVLDRIEKEG